MNQLRKLPLPEVTVRELRVGDNQIGIFNAPLAEPDDVEIERSRPPALSANPSALLLDGLQRREQTMRIEAGFEQHHPVEISRLPHPGEWSGLLDRPRRHYPRFGKLLERLTRSRKVRGSIAQIASQRHEYLLASRPTHAPTAKCRAIRCR